MNMFLNLKLEYFISFLFTLLCTFMIKSEQQNWWKPALHVHSQAEEVALLCSPATDHHFRNIQCHGKLGGKDPTWDKCTFCPVGHWEQWLRHAAEGGWACSGLCPRKEAACQHCRAAGVLKQRQQGQGQSLRLWLWKWESPFRFSGPLGSHT